MSTDSNRLAEALMEPFEAATMRQRRAVMPPGGRQEHPMGPLGRLGEIGGGIVDFLMPTGPLDVGFTIAAGPFGKVGTKVAAATLGAMLESDEAQAGVGSRAVKWGSGIINRIRSALPMDEASRMARAREMGFQVDLPLGHGTAPLVPFREFDPSRLGSMTRAAPARRGVWAEVNPKPGGIAEDFALLAAARTRGTPRVVPLLHRADRRGRIALTGDESAFQIAATLDKAWDDGFDAVMFNNFIMRPGQTGSILVVKDPAQLRDPSAV